jgi:hypothetical protein
LASAVKPANGPAPAVPGVPLPVKLTSVDKVAMEILPHDAREWHDTGIAFAHLE